MFWTIALLAGVSADAQDSSDKCIPPSASLQSAAGYLGEMNLAAARSELGEFKNGLECDERITPETAAHYFQATAVLALLMGEADTSKRAFASAKTIDAESWFSDLGFEGTAYHNLFMETEPLAGNAVRIGFDKPANLGKDEWFAIDGEVVVAPFDTTPGLHTLQVGTTEGPSRYGRVIDRQPGENVNLDLNSATEAPIPWASSEMLITSRFTPEQRRRRRIATSLITGGAAAAMFGGSVGARAAYDGNTTGGLRTTTNALHAASICTGVASAVIMGVALGSNPG